MTFLAEESVSSGLYQTYAITGYRHALGVGHIVAYGRSKVAERKNLPTDGGYVAVAASNVGGAALKADGSLRLFGNDDARDKFGINLPTDPLATITCGDFFGAGLTPSGEIRIWGALSSIVSAPIGGGWRDLSAGGSSGLFGIDATGTIRYLGYDEYNRKQNMPTTAGWDRVKATSHGCYALHTDGHVVYMGSTSNNEDQDLPAPNVRFTRLFGGRYFGGGIRADTGAIQLWGDDTYHQRDNIPTGTSPIVALDGGYYSGALIRENGVLEHFGEKAPSEAVYDDFPTDADQVGHWGVSDPRKIDLDSGQRHGTMIYQGRHHVTNAEAIYFGARKVWETTP
jgi:hypothetical protein